MQGTSTKAVVLAAVLAAIAGCGGSKNGNPDGNMDGLDGFLSSGCTTASDCVADACSVAKCNAATHQCQTTPKSCTQPNGCTVSTSTCALAMCSASSGQAVWSTVPQGEGMTCTTDQGAAGTCMSGTCTALPSCYNPSGFSTAMVACGPDNSSETVGNNDPTGTDGAMATVSSYTCAPNEAGPELAVPFSLSSMLTATSSVTVTLRLVDPTTYATLANQATVDLDLIILEGQCSGTATCANPTSGSGSSTVVQGVTAGTSAERVTFMADPTKTYYLVVDSKDATQVGTYIVSVEACGQCAVTPQTDLDCNTSMAMPVMSTTMGGSKVLTNYTCTTGTTMTNYALAGDEVPFLLRDAAGVARNITATLSGASMGTGLMVLNQATDGDCQGMNCIGGSTVTTAGTNATVTWTTAPADAQFSGQPIFERFWVVVDTPSTTDTSFGLSVACNPYCTADPNVAIDCSAGTYTTAGTSTMGLTANVSQWGTGAPCNTLTGLTGPEDVVTFAPNITGSKTYQIELESDTTGKNLSLVILDAGATATCDPTATCASYVATNPTGTTGTYTTAAGKTAAVTLTANSGHTYYLVVDGTDASGANYKISVTGTQTGAGCGM